jgi:hypothetical protein
LRRAWEPTLFSTFRTVLVAGWNIVLVFAAFGLIYYLG